MGRSFYRPSTRNTIGSTGKAITFYHKASDSHFRMIERDGHFYQARYQIGQDGKETNVLEKQIDFVLGSGNHVRSYLSRTSRNTLIELPLAWYAENGGSWGMNPGYDRADHEGFRRQITYGCIFCHNGIPEIPPGNETPGAEPVFSGTLPEGIDCQRCHGPGRKHIEIAQTAGARLENLRKSIVNPAKLSADREMEVCMQCHLETTSFRLPNAVVRYDRGPFSYRPGEPLANFEFQFDQAPGNSRFEIASAAYRLRRSACFLKSGGALRCTTCHNPHDIPRGEEAIQHYTRVCEQCHAATIQQLVSAGKHTASTDCLGCHMPKRRTDDVVHVVLTDHYIQRHKPAGESLAALAERHETDENAYHGEVVPYYPPSLPKNADGELYRAVAQVSQKSNLKDGIPALTDAIEKYHPERIEFSLQLGDALLADGNRAKALAVYESALERQPNSFAALRKLGSALRSAGQFSRAAEMLKHATEVDPRDAAAWHELGLAYLNEGLRTDGTAAFQKAIALDPEMAEAYNSLGGVWLESGNLSQAQTAFAEAIRIQPDYAEAHSNLGSALAAANRMAEATYQFQLAIELKPDYAAARFNYAIALARANRFPEAQRQIEAVLKIHPESAEAHDLLGNLLLAQRIPDAAAAQFREALRLRPEFSRAHLDFGVMLAEAGDLKGALPHLREAAASADQSVRQEAAQMLQQFGSGR